MPKSVTRSSKLGAAERAAAIEVLKTKELDILVIGGGIVGTGSALDAATRGLRVGIVEARDWASGTSSPRQDLIGCRCTDERVQAMRSDTVSLLG